MLKELNFIALCGFFVLLACGESSLPEPGRNDRVHYMLTVSDSIGVEYGDENSAFGAIYAIENGIQGNVFVMDVCDNSIREFERTGSFVRSYGGVGEGPLELNMPGFFTVTSESNLYVIDSGQFVEFYPDGTLLKRGAWGQSENIQWVEPLSDGKILGILSEYDIRNDRHFIVNRIAIWQDTLPETTKRYIFEREYELSSDEFMNSITRIDYFPILFAGSEDLICIAPDPVESPVLYMFSSAGVPLDTLELPYEPVLKTQQELTDEKLFIEHAVYTNSFGNVSIDWTPEPYRPYISSLGFDSASVLWVQRGGSSIPSFDLIDSEGEIIGAAELEGREDTRYWHFEIDPAGIIAFDLNPIDYQRVFVISKQ